MYGNWYIFGPHKSVDQSLHLENLDREDLLILVEFSHCKKSIHATMRFEVVQIKQANIISKTRSFEHSSLIIPAHCEQTSQKTLRTKLRRAI